MAPPWFVDVVNKMNPSHSWWQVYLDNFMAAEVSHSGTAEQTDLHLHEAAVESWREHGVLCSEDKHVRGADVAIELGVQIHGPGGLLGAGADRIYKALLATLGLLSHGPPKVKQLQILLGRWIFILQYRRVAMSVLSRSWDYLNAPCKRKSI